MRKFGRTAIAFAVIGAALLLAVAAARAADKSVVIYSANESVLDELVFSTFTKESGIAVQPVSAGSGVLMKRIGSEKERPQGDIIWGVSRSLLQSNAQYFAPYHSKNVDAIPAEYRDPNDLWIGNNLHLLVILQNTKLVPEGQGPKSWDDLLDPKWKGKIAFSGVGNGEYPLGVSLEYAGYVWASNGAPIKVIYPSDGTVVAMEGVAVIKGGPNTESAKAFVDFINRKDTRELIFAKTFRRPARQDLDFSKLPGNMPALSTIKIAAYDEAGWTEKRPATMAKIQEIVEKTR